MLHYQMQGMLRQIRGHAMLSSAGSTQAIIVEDLHLRSQFMSTSMVAVPRTMPSQAL